MARARLLRKFNFGNDSEGIKFKKEDPAIIPVIIKPVIKGSFILWKIFAICCPAIATITNPTKITKKLPSTVGLI